MKQRSFRNCGEISLQLKKPYKYVSEKNKLLRDTLNKNLNLLNKSNQRHLSGNIWSNSGGREGPLAQMAMLFHFVLNTADIRQVNCDSEKEPLVLE